MAAGGLHVVGTERHESRRIDNQVCYFFLTFLAGTRIGRGLLVRLLILYFLKNI